MFVKVRSADPSLSSRDLGESDYSGSLGGCGTGWSPFMIGGGSGITTACGYGCISTLLIGSITLGGCY